MDNQEFRNAYQAARIKHEDANHSFPFDNCYMPECEAAWEKMNMSNDDIATTNPTEQLEALATHQQKVESLLQARTGLTVKVSFSVHTTDNSTPDLLQLFEASLTSPDFRQVCASNRTWIAHKDLGRNISIFMPKNFYFDKVYPEPEDDEGYNQAVEYDDARRWLELTSGATRDQTDEPGPIINTDEIPF